MDSLIFVLGITYLGLTVYMANIQQRDGSTVTSMPNSSLRWLLYISGGLTGIMALNLLFAAVFPAESIAETGTPVYEVSSAGAVFGVTFALAAAFLIFYLITSSTGREHVSRLMGPERRYDPDSPVHLTAMVLSLMIITSVVVSFWISGGSEALADELQNINIAESLLQNFVWILISVLGVGFAIRRNERRTIYRLGLRIPTSDDWVWGVGMGFGLVIITIIIGLFLTLFWGEIGTDAATNQVETLASLGLPSIALLMIAVAVGEEIFFRGALQPVFGNGLTTGFFITMHVQALFDPAILGLVAVSLILGWLRDRYSTVAAIFAHLTYNFIIVGLQMLAETSA